ncbi:hypothetical protein [Bosea sp. 685]|uniref:hypothetical protein n=1 Tax=Bosea sp. 685 TaxID=3080057 RepID=UPI002892D27E|nr:hypothetical protein [Bosea sp. 685]WNJ92024.1 hypothetical protein RMR04_06900 [Bosea sp. 685]
MIAAIAPLRSRSFRRPPFMATLISSFSFSFAQSLLTHAKSRIARPRIAQTVAAIALGVAALGAMASAPAAAAERPAWETACAYKQPSGTFGNGYTVVADMCARLRSCQAISDRGGDLAQAGCFDFEAAPRPAGRRS